MGVVHKARQIALGRLVALKLIRSAEFATRAELSRFQNEAEAVARLDHPTSCRFTRWASTAAFASSA